MVLGEFCNAVDLQNSLPIRVQLIASLLDKVKCKLVEDKCMCGRESDILHLPAECPPQSAVTLGKSNQAETSVNEVERRVGSGKMHLRVQSQELAVSLPYRPAIHFLLLHFHRYHP